MAAANSGWNLGFLTILHEPTGYLGGYLVTNQWGRPLEFRLSTAVQPNRVQQILYGPTLEAYLCGDLIAKTLIDKTGTPTELIITDHPAAMDVRVRVDKPVGLLKGPHGIETHPEFPRDDERIHDLIAQVGGGLSLAEPFTRIREAIGEARKLGVTGRG